MVDVHVYKL